MSADPFLAIAEQFTAESTLAEVIIAAVRDTSGCLKPSALFGGLSAESAQMYAREVNSLIDRQILSTYFHVENGVTETYIGFSVA